MNWKKILIIFVTLFFIGAIARVIIFYKTQSIAEEFTQFAESADAKAKEALIKSITINMRVSLLEWKNQNGNYSNFVKNNDLAEMRPSMPGDIAKANVDYKIFTTAQNYVIKIKPTDEAILYCM